MSRHPTAIARALADLPAAVPLAPSAIIQDRLPAIPPKNEFPEQSQGADAFAPAEVRFGSLAILARAALSGYRTFLALELNPACYPMPQDGCSRPRWPE